MVSYSFYEFHFDLFCSEKCLFSCNSYKIIHAVPWETENTDIKFYSNIMERKYKWTSNSVSDYNFRNNIYDDASTTYRYIEGQCCNYT